MKVLCIDTSVYPRTDEVKALSLIKEGNEYNVKQSCIYDDCYSVEGISYDFNGAHYHHYDKRRFVPISEIDETEFERDYNKELLTQ